MQVRDRGPDPETLARICAATGCTVRRVQTVAGGQHAYTIECHTHANKVKLLDALAHYDSRDAEVRGLGEMFSSYHGGDADRTMAELQRWMQRAVTHIQEPTETFTHTMRTIEIGRGDCDDQARAVAAILRSIGIPARLVTLGRPPRHVYAQGQRTDGQWCDLETTVRAYPGESPLAAAKRLGIKGRDDL